MRLAPPTKECALALFVAACSVSGCSHSQGGASAPLFGAIHAGPEANRGPNFLAQSSSFDAPRLVPTKISSPALVPSSTSPPRGVERRIVAGVRIERHLGGGMATAERLPEQPSMALEVPARLGGGFLFVVGGRSIVRSETWLSWPSQIFQSPWVISDLEFGLDRIFVRFSDGSREGIDPRTGDRIGFGAFPAAPTVTQIVALDAWRAIAIADLVGVVATFDAGSTWVPITVPGKVRRVFARDEALHLESIDERGEKLDFEVRGPQQLVRSSPPATATQDRDMSLSARWLALAVEEGWPLDDRSALVLHEGDLLRIDLASGLVVERVPKVLRGSDARCQAIPMGEPGGFGFTCAEKAGETAIYLFDRAKGNLTPAGRWATPRAVLSSGNGLISIKGSCLPDGPPTAGAFCVRARNGSFRETFVERGERARFVPMSDGSFVVFDPPTAAFQGDLRITVGGRTNTVPLNMSLVPHAMERGLRYGVWLDGFEERRSGVIGGWLNVGGTMVGCEVSIDGTLLFGPPLDVGNAFVAGRYGSAWGYESTDGGMHWNAVDAPLAEPGENAGAATTTRATGPVGSLSRNWLRIGWGAKPPRGALVAPVVAGAVSRRTELELALSCVRAPDKALPAGNALDAPVASVVPTLTKDDESIVVDVNASLSRHRGTTLARIYAWRPKHADASSSAKWMIRWTSDSTGRVRTSAIAAMPRSLTDALVAHWGGAQRQFGFELLLARADEDHALLVIRQYGREDLPFELEQGSAPFAVTRSDGEGLRDTTSAIRLLGQWYVATSTSELAELWRLESGRAVSIASVPRAGAELRSAVALGGDAVARAVGIIVEGARVPGARNPTQWMLPISIDRGVPGTPFALPRFGESSAEARTCGVDAEGFNAEVPWSISSKFRVGTADGWVLTTSVRGIFQREGGCMSYVHGTLSKGGELHSERVHPMAPVPRARVSISEQGGKRVLYDCSTSAE